MCIGLQFPDMVDNLSALYQSMDSRTRLVDRLSKLKGKLELMLSQVLPSFQNKYYDFYISKSLLGQEGEKDVMVVPYPY